MDQEDTTPLVTEFIRIIQEMRKAKGLTLEQLADLAGIHRTTIGLLEGLQRSPSLNTADSLARALGQSLSEILVKAELIATGEIAESRILGQLHQRQTNRGHIRNEKDLLSITGLSANSLLQGIDYTYQALDAIDEQLLSKELPPISQMVELANLSSMVGNLLAAGLSRFSDGLYIRNRPHTFPDLLPVGPGAVNLELKVALETNRPKGHLAKAGSYITFRYVLCSKQGKYARGKTSRGDTVWIWEVKIGQLTEADFALSSTPGDSGKTAIIKSDVFDQMPLVYFVPDFMPYIRSRITHP